MIRFWMTVLLFGILQGVTEWLPISSTGHMLLLGDLLPMPVSEEFFGLFLVVIQLGSVFAVAVLYPGKLFPFGKEKTPLAERGVFSLWGKVIVAALPSMFFGLLLDDFIEEKVYQNDTVGCAVIAAALASVGVLFIVAERCLAGREDRVSGSEDLSFRDAFFIGCFQVCALIPGVSRSGSTILGARVLGVSRGAAAEFSFFLALPVMAGASCLKLIKYFLSGLSLTGEEIGVLFVGALCAFLVSLTVIRFLSDFVRRHSFEVFGWYRIGLAAVLAGYLAARFL